MGPWLLRPIKNKALDRVPMARGEGFMLLYPVQALPDLAAK
jgi:hypothetical protein